MRVLHAEPTRARTFTALVVDHEPPARAAMGTVLRRLGATDVFEANDQVQARVAALSGQPRDLCVLNLDLPGGGLNLLADLRNAGWPRLLVTSAKPDAFSLRAAFVAGAHGYLLTAGADTTAATPRIPSPRLPSQPLPRHAVHALAQQTTAQPVSLKPVERARRQLSAREIEVLALVAAGQSNNSAGQHLQLSALTVKSHLARIARKLGTGDRAHMVAVAMRAGLID